MGNAATLVQSTGQHAAATAGPGVERDPRISVDDVAEVAGLHGAGDLEDKTRGAPSIERFDAGRGSDKHGCDCGGAEVRLRWVARTIAEAFESALHERGGHGGVGNRNAR